MVYFIDSNIFLRVIVEEDSKSFSECKELLQKVEGRKIRGFSSNIVMAEIVWVLSSYYKMKKLKVLEGLLGIRNLTTLKLIDKYQFDLALKLYSKFKVKFIDCLIASIPQIFSKTWPIISYDKDFDKLDVVRFEPGEVPQKWMEKEKVLPGR